LVLFQCNTLWATESAKRHRVDGQKAVSWQVLTDTPRRSWVSLSVQGVSVAVSDYARRVWSIWGLRVARCCRVRKLAMMARSHMMYRAVARRGAARSHSRWGWPIGRMEPAGEILFSQSLLWWEGHTTTHTGGTATGRSIRPTLPLLGSMLRSDGSTCSGRSSGAWR
jgi:hypothetical protein